LGIGGALLSANTTGTSQSQLSARAKPPSDLSIIGGFMILMAIVTFFATKDGDSSLLGIAGAVLLFAAGTVIAVKLSEKHKRDLAIWRETRMCARCGVFYI